MNKSKRLTFLKSFLKLYDVKRIPVSNESNLYIKGVAVYNEFDSDERQEFIWYKTEHEVPSSDLIKIIDKIVADKLHDGDKIYRQVEALKFKEFDVRSREELIKELFEINITMIDNEKKLTAIL